MVEQPMESTGEAATCGVCGESLSGTRTARLYGHLVTLKCRDAFVRRRELAWILDYFLVIAFAFIITAFVVAAAGMAESKNPDEDAALGYTFGLGVSILFTLKDSVRGLSPGKLMLGLQVVDEDTGNAIGPIQSLKRNLIIVVPFAPIVLAFMLRSGPRPGDGWANTRVIDRRRAAAPVFLGKLAPSEGWDLSSSKGWH